MIQRFTQASRRQPYHRPQDPWVETVLASEEGGPFPPVSVRQMSLRRRRQQFTWALAALTAGVLMLVWSSPGRMEMLSPGPLTSPHAQILADTGSQRCVACHPAAESGFVAWMGSLLAGSSPPGLSQSDRCLQCHASHFDPVLAKLPHHQPAVLLAQQTERVWRQLGSADGAARRPAIASGELACSTCHREHHGAQASLSSLSDQQCQSCHARSFHSFELDHPEFDRYPLKRRPRIAFDHSRHANQHFPGLNTSFDCRQCHLDDDYRNVKQLASYEQACAACHDGRLEQSSASGLTLLALPMLDMSAIEEAGLSVGQWPLGATGDFDGPLPPLMRHLLLADPQAQEVLHRRDTDFHFGDLDPEREQDVRDAVTLVWATKRLLRELGQEGPAAIEQRLGSGSVGAIPGAGAALTGLSDIVFQTAAAHWLPGLREEVPDPVVNPQAKRGPVVPGQFPVLPLAGDRREADAAEGPGLPAWMQDRALLETVARRISYQQEIEEEDLLAVNPLTGLMGGQGSGSRPADPPGALDPLPAAGSESALDPNAPPGPRSPPVEPAEAADPGSRPDRVQRAESGSLRGWIRDDLRFEIRYQPRGHSDTVVRGWIEMALAQASRWPSPASDPLLQSLTGASAWGQCLDCHTVDRQPSGPLEVQWNSVTRDPAIRSFTRFSHAPHLVLPHLQDCRGCHEMRPETGPVDALHRWDPSHYQSNFQPITRQQCATCHRQGATGSGCTQCHHYHVGSRLTGSH